MLINNENNHTDHRFSFEVLLPLKGSGTEACLPRSTNCVLFNPRCINITTHHSEFVYNEPAKRTIPAAAHSSPTGHHAIAAAIQQRFQIPVIPHIICSGASTEDIEYELIDLQFLGIENVLLLRGDKAKDDRVFTPTAGGHAHTTDLIRQVNRFNEGFFADGTPIKNPGPQFHFGVACYPEKHEEAPNLEFDLDVLKQKQDMGAEYAVTQLFYDNAKFIRFVMKARQMGITIPILPGLKPFASFVANS